MPDVQYVYIQKIAKWFLKFEYPFINLKKYHFYFHQLHFYLLEQFKSFCWNNDDFKWGL